MRINFIRNIEKKIKGKLGRLRLKQTDFTIISNNCWGTFIYKKFDLPYQSPFVNLLIFAEDYIRMLENFSPNLFNGIYFIPHKESKHIIELTERKYLGLEYPIGVIGDEIEIHFLHYKSENEAKQKWEERIKRINYDKLLFKFSDSEICSDDLIYRFERLAYKNKICFTAKPFPHCKSNIYLPHFKNTTMVQDEWKHSEKEYNIVSIINNL
jgi:uncharacterized protein (DUF1919 family)